MSNSLDTVRDMVEMALFRQNRKTETELRAFIRTVSLSIEPHINEEEVEKIARNIEAKQGIKAGLSAVVDSGDFKPWLDDAKPTIEPFYWSRYEKLLVKNGLPKDVIIQTDIDTDMVLGRLGNPRLEEQWDRRGMVVGNVQSGKTANYTGLICKAADAGYRLIIVIAGIHNNLRNQTQARIDEGFIGRDTGKIKTKKSSGTKNVIGVGHFDQTRTPVSLTNTLRDFNKETASTNTSEIDSYKVPVVLVIKKNYRTLANLLEWLKDNSARGDQEMIDQPMLLIDDEADNASINTKYGKQLVTTINGQIRDLLKMFHRSCYVGYTATPFANIFIDPDQEDEMFNEDLFPRDFIVGLDAPKNYFGPYKVFVDGLPDDDEPKWLRYIGDNEDILPIKHKIDHQIESLPDSLVEAVRVFLLSRTIRNLRGHKASHCSMLVNASRFTNVQSLLRIRLHEKLETIRNAVRVNAGKGATALDDPEIGAIFKVWSKEYAGCKEMWSSVLAELHEAIAATKVVEVNSRANGLEYGDDGETGQTVIAVGGFSLSRGLTLEGLTVTWFLRNTKMYDTLMQMGRWFGYRNNYEDLCRIWMPSEAIGWYSYIANATAELHEELHAMEAAKATPQMFGLSVRSHPASLLVTARNKMGSGKKVTTLVGLSNKFLETSRVSTDPSDLRANTNSAIGLIQEIENGEFEENKVSSGHCVMRVPVSFIDSFLARWRNVEQSITTNPEPVRQYIRARSKDELSEWDVLITGLQKGIEDYSLGRSIIPITREVNAENVKKSGYIPFGGDKMRVATGSFEKAGLAKAEIIKVEAQFKSDKGHTNYPGSIYRKVRNRPLLMLMLVKPKIKNEDHDPSITSLLSAPIVTWGMSLPVSARPGERVEYVVNTVRYQELFGYDDEDEEQEADLEK